MYIISTVIALALSKEPEYLNPCLARYHLGDIALSTDDVERITKRHKRGATSEINRIWPNGVIYYDIHPSFSIQFVKKFRLAMRHWELNTCVQFLPRKKDLGYILFAKEFDFDQEIFILELQH